MVKNRDGENGISHGWIQTLFREKVKSQSIGNRTFNSESASKIMPAYEIRVFECRFSAYFSKKQFRSF